MCDYVHDVWIYHNNKEFIKYLEIYDGFPVQNFHEVTRFLLWKFGVFDLKIEHF